MQFVDRCLQIGVHLIGVDWLKPIGINSHELGRVLVACSVSRNRIQAGRAGSATLIPAGPRCFVRGEMCRRTLVRGGRARVFYTAHDELRPATHLIVYSDNVFAQNSDAERVESAEKDAVTIFDVQPGMAKSVMSLWYSVKPKQPQQTSKESRAIA